MDIQIANAYCLDDYIYHLTLKHRESHGRTVSTVATDALVLKHQAFSILSTDYTFNLLDQFHMKILHFC